MSHHEKGRNKIQHRKSFITPSLHLCIAKKCGLFFKNMCTSSLGLPLLSAIEACFKKVQRCRDGVINDFFYWILFLPFS